MTRNISYNEFEQLLEQYVNMPKSIVMAAREMLPNVINRDDNTRFIVQFDENKPNNIKVSTSEIMGLDAVNYYYSIDANEISNEYNIVGECKHTDLSSGKVSYYFCDNVNIKQTELGYNGNPGFVVSSDHRQTRSDSLVPTTLYDESMERTRFFDSTEVEVHTKYDMKKYAKREGQYSFNFGLTQRNLGNVVENVNSIMNRDDLAHANMTVNVYDANRNLKNQDTKYFQIDQNKKQMAVVGIVTKKEYEEDRVLYNQNKMNEVNVSRGL